MGDQYLSDQTDSFDSDVRTKTYPFGSVDPHRPIPEYTVIDSSASYDMGIYMYTVSISVDSLREEDLRAIAEDFAGRTGDYDQGLIFVYEERFQPYDPVPNTPGPPRSSVDESPLLQSAGITVEHYRERYRIVRSPWAE